MELKPDILKVQYRTEAADALNSQDDSPWDEETED